MVISAIVEHIDTGAKELNLLCSWFDVAVTPNSQERSSFKYLGCQVLIRQIHTVTILFWAASAKALRRNSSLPKGV